METAAALVAGRFYSITGTCFSPLIRINYFLEKIEKFTSLGSILGVHSENAMKKVKKSPQKIRLKELIHSSSERQKTRRLVTPSICEWTRHYAALSRIV
jgi:hypothetical protein